MNATVTEPIEVFAQKVRELRSPILVGGVALVAALALIAGLVLGVSVHSRNAVPSKIADVASVLAEEPASLPGQASDLLGGAALGLASPGASSATGSGLLKTPALAAIAPTAGVHPGAGVSLGNLPGIGDLNWPDNLALPDNLLQNVKWTMNANGIANLASNLATSIGGYGVSAAVATANVSTNLLTTLILYSAYTKNGSGLLSGLQNLLPKLGGTSAAAAALPNLSLPKLASVPLIQAPKLPKLDVPALGVPLLKVPKLPRLHRHGGIPFVPFI